MEQRALLAVILSFLVLFIYSQYFMPKPEPESTGIHDQKEVGPGQTAPDKGTVEPPQAMETPTTPEERSVETTPPPVAIEATSENITPREIVVENGTYIAHLSNKGAILKRFTLKKYRDRVDDEGLPYEMIRQLPNVKYYPLTLIFQNTALTASFEQGMYQPDSELDQVYLDDQNKCFSVQFSRTDPSGIEVVKKVTLHHDSYVIDVEITVRNRSQATTNISWSLVCAEGLGPEGFEKSRYIHAGPIFMVRERNKDNLENIKTNDLDEGERTFKTGLQWAGISSPYFCASLIPAAQHNLYGTAWNAQADMSVVAVKTPLIEGQPGYDTSFDLQYYLGPKERAHLEKAPQNLLRIIDYGIFSIIALPLFKALLFFHGYMKSWGLAIIALTVLIKILFYPLTRSSFQSMEKMKIVQPEMNEIRSKYKDDPNRLNKEIWALYKKHKVNPMGSCFPMLLQIPVFFALYNVLYVSIELRHSSFLYIPDLSAYDPYYISPILMGASMLLQQHMTPVMGDPKQAQVMKLMPIIFTVMFIYFPSGLVIYWLVNNVITIGQQYLIKRKNTISSIPVAEVELPERKGKKKKRK
ncbi:membrane protein insertase YidC [bacterium]|nr:membrane protein insertase YidC [bacterium]